MGAGDLGGVLGRVLHLEVGRSVLVQVADELGGGEEVVAAGGLRVVARPQRAVPVPQVALPSLGEPCGDLVQVHRQRGESLRVNVSVSGVLNLNARNGSVKRGSA
ncbi:hypothetical protein GCM10017744_008240 [Streptomyces antimycoticus]|uniref:Uncharacterized protein n=1 Tax=Streptomyces antimycoticus TaxID=68175 RepID=A0A4D4KJE4_9ACTN|nr:hypothetical protein SANT12839_091860 [Streptomyces antimycoticus]